jgi:hypothetical protein
MKKKSYRSKYLFNKSIEKITKSDIYQEYRMRKLEQWYDSSEGSQPGVYKTIMLLRQNN